MGDAQIDSTGEQFSLFLRSSKCDPFKKGIEIKIFENSNFKPVQEMIQYLHLCYESGADSSFPLFVNDEYDLVPLSGNVFI